MKVNLKENETVIKVADTSYVEPQSRVTGKFILTNQRIYFKSIEETNNGVDFEILFSQIREILFFNTWKIIPNGLNVVTKEGSELKFLLKNRDSWCQIINKMY
ncbi:MAG: hypothetical protein JW783_01985 [Bacteroidales bacterium]|nr:hypothetical protein [Bacteroidales bacterium]MBN2750835.1 hypothetical protein [Bacteroidales bacterium]